MKVMLTENLTAALTLAIEAQQVADEEFFGPGGRSTFLGGLVEIRDALRRGERIELRDAIEHAAVLRGRAPREAT